MNSLPLWIYLECVQSMRVLFLLFSSHFISQLKAHSTWNETHRILCCTFWEIARRKKRMFRIFCNSIIQTEWKIKSQKTSKVSYFTLSPFLGLKSELWTLNKRWSSTLHTRTEYWGNKQVALAVRKIWVWIYGRPTILL